MNTPSGAGGAWVGTCIAALVLTALIVFTLQNRQPIQATRISMHGTVSLDIPFIAGISVGIVALVIGTIRISQLRRRLSQKRQPRQRQCRTNGPTLVAQAEHADLLVIRTREHTGIDWVLRGSLSHHCLSRLRCPFVAVADPANLGIGQPAATRRSGGAG
jgi:uncharacterized integral membrane protein